MKGPLLLPSGCCVQDPLERLGAFFDEEWDFYDAIRCLEPGCITPVDILVTAFRLVDPGGWKEEKFLRPPT